MIVFFRVDEMPNIIQEEPVTKYFPAEIQVTDKPL